MTAESVDRALQELETQRSVCEAAIEDVRELASNLARLTNEGELRKGLNDLRGLLEDAHRSLERMDNITNTLSEASAETHEGEAGGGGNLGEFESVRDVFERLLPSLLDNPVYQGRFVAVTSDGIVDCGDDECDLAERVASNCLGVPVYIGRVQVELPEVILSSPEFTA